MLHMPDCILLKSLSELLNKTIMLGVAYAKKLTVKLANLVCHTQVSERI